MNKLDNYKYLFFKKLYEELDLKSIEANLEKENIKSLNVVDSEYYKIISKYFFILNDVNINFLTQEDLQTFNLYFSKDIYSLKEEELNEIYQFIEKTYSMVLFPNIDSKFVYYGPITDDYICPKDSVVIGLFYDIFSSEEPLTIQNKLADIVNYIQFEQSKKSNKNISVLLFNQLTLQNNQLSFTK